jgi:hypothetical protein
VGSALAALVLLTAAEGQSVAPSSIPVDDLKLEPQLAYGVLGTLAKKYHVVIGVSGKVMLDGVKEPLVNISLKHGTLSQVFDAIVAADPSYSWTITSAGSVHFVVGDPLPLWTLAFIYLMVRSHQDLMAVALIKSLR